MDGNTIKSDTLNYNVALRLWLMLLFILVFIMIIVGGLTRLTDSGLSIVEWAPISGVIPPVTELDWQEEFNKYKKIPEYILVNNQISLAEFKFIYWWEWSHRQLGRLIGMVWIVGLLLLIFYKRIPEFWTFKLVFLGVLGGIQGFIGWWMVSSGLKDSMVDVASYRLAIHLGIAFSILGLIFWLILKSYKSPKEIILSKRYRDVKLYWFANILLVCLLCQICLGALVAGIDAGNSYNDWPFMGGQVIPEDYLFYSPIWINLLDNPAAVQFNHRILGYVILFLSFFCWFLSLKRPLVSVKKKFQIVLLVVFIQVVLGVLTLVQYSPIELAIFHQITGVILFVSTVSARFETAYPSFQKS